MTTLVAQEREEPDKIYEMWELPRGARVPVHYRREEVGKEPVEGDCIAVFKYIDGMYGLWYDEESGERLIFNARFKKKDGLNFEIYKSEEENV